MKSIDNNHALFRREDLGVVGSCKVGKGLIEPGIEVFTTLE